ncbi:nanos homolog 1 [Nematostella vectensis]|uniref:Nanos 2 n=1 Tax=Nematostella vectensis TaxID=45351 RepID=Q5IGV1_NEMVE|nr:nanos homolog 1 [Nematostella vectensis]AAW29071.1 Nanos 2 [Nematostella vectensis]
MSLSEVMLKTLIPSNFLDSDDEEIKSLTCTTESDDLQKNQYTNYNMFNDYFGLSNLVQKVRLANNDFPYLGSDGYGGKLHRRDRFDSIDSENSSSGSCDSFTDHGLTFGEGSFQPFSTSSILHSAGKRKEVALPPSRRLGKPTARSSAPGANRQVCVFCRNNGESEEVYASHVLKSADGKTTCPILRAYTCPICKASGDDSHTIKYCPQNQQTQGNGQLPPPPVKPPTSTAQPIARSTRGIMPPKRR